MLSKNRAWVLKLKDSQDKCTNKVTWRLLNSTKTEENKQTNKNKYF